MLNYVINKGDTTYLEGIELIGKSDTVLDLISFVSKNLVYPEQAKQNGIEGKVIVAVIIDKFGKLESSKIIKGCPAGLNEAALKVVQEMPFIPIKRGQ